MASLVKPSPECRRRAGRNGGLVFLIPLLKPSEGRSRSAGAQGLCFEVGFLGRLSPSQVPMGESDKRRGSSESPPRRAGSPWVSRRLAKGPADAWPGKRADHGGSAPVFQAQQESVAQEGEPRSFERRRESGSEERPLPGPPETTRRAGGTRWLLRAMAQAQMALGALAETKVPRPPGRDPANIYRRRATLLPPSVAVRALCFAVKFSSPHFSPGVVARAWRCP